MVLLSGCAEHGKIDKKAQLTLWQTNIAMGNDWDMDHWKMYFLHKIGIFHCHVSLPLGIGFILATLQLGGGLPNMRRFVWHNVLVVMVHKHRIRINFGEVWLWHPTQATTEASQNNYLCGKHVKNCVRTLCKNYVRFLHGHAESKFEWEGVRQRGKQKDTVEAYRSYDPWKVGHEMMFFVNGSIGDCCRWLAPVRPHGSSQIFPALNTFTRKPGIPLLFVRCTPKKISNARCLP